MTEKEDRLKRAFASMDTAKLAARARDPDVTALARSLALAELQRRESQPAPGLPELEPSRAVAVAEGDSGVGPRAIAVGGSALVLLLGALAVREYDFVILQGAVILILLSRLLPRLGAACGLVLTASPLLFWLNGAYSTGNWLLTSIFVFMSLIAVGVGLSMIHAAFYRGGNAEFLADLERRAEQAGDQLRGTRR